MIIYIALPQTLYFAYQLIVNDNFSLSFFHEKGRAMSEEKQAEEGEKASTTRLLIGKKDFIANKLKMAIFVAAVNCCCRCLMYISSMCEKLLETLRKCFQMHNRINEII